MWFSVLILFAHLHVQHCNSSTGWVRLSNDSHYFENPHHLACYESFGMFYVVMFIVPFNMNIFRPPFGAGNNHRLVEI